jgi:conjugal transfer/entry exclusion protein
LNQLVAAKYNQLNRLAAILGAQSSLEAETASPYGDAVSAAMRKAYDEERKLNANPISGSDQPDRVTADPKIRTWGSQGKHI